MGGICRKGLQIERYGKEMEAYKVSLIVPVYNTEAYLKRCVASLREQSYENLEIILVDDGSTDHSGKLCDEYEWQDARIKVIHKKNGGLISAWKAGVEGSTGEYLCFVDSDDWVDTTMVSEMAKQLSGSDREIISSDYVIEWENGNQQYVWQELPAGVYEGAELRKVVPRLLGQEKRYVCISRCMKLISRSLVEDNCKYSDPAIRMGEDTMIMLPSLIDCERLVIMDHKAYYHYFYVSESMVHKYDRNLFKNIELLRKIINRIVHDKFEGTYLWDMQTRADQEYLLLLLLALKNEARGNKEGYRRNILEICRKDEVRQVVKRVNIKVDEKSNKLLYLVLRHPNHLTVSLLRAAMIVYYRRR